jgi:hypothetical protein
VFVPWRTGVSQEAVQSASRQRRIAVVVKLPEYQLADFARQGLIGFGGFQQVVQLGVGDVSITVQSGLPDGVVAQVVQVLGG